MSLIVFFLLSKLFQRGLEFRRTGHQCGDPFRITVGVKAFLVIIGKALVSFKASHGLNLLAVLCSNEDVFDSREDGIFVVNYLRYSKPNRDKEAEHDEQIFHYRQPRNLPPSISRDDRIARG